MLNNHARQQSERILRLNWVLTGDPFRPLRSSWSLDIPNERQIIRTPGLPDLCNPAVIKKCETSGIRGAREEDQARSLTMSGK
jgi:hypothetical protein